MMEEGNNSSKHRRVLSIVGFGGLGKTTLANEVYRKIQGHFHCRVFVSISQKPDTKKIIKDMIYKLPSPHGFTEGIDIWDEVTSIAKLRELLQDKRYLIVIDDIWSTPAWDAIKCAFPDNSFGSRIIVTTRIIDVARSCCPSGDDRIYGMKTLNDLHSQRLFFKRIFGSVDCCPDMLKEVSNKILKKCGGLPLAIISISSLLANIPVVKEEWEKIKRSIGSALEKNRSLEGMSSILSLSYNYLPTNLKTCLLYLSAFPKDHAFDRERLVRRWIAEGFISEERGQSKHGVAQRYFYDLINKSMIHPVGIQTDGVVHFCRVHDMMLEILILKSAEDNFITVVSSSEASLANRNFVIRRLSIQHIDQEIASRLENEDLTKVRSLTIAITSGGIKHLPGLVKFQALRVLDFAFDGDLDEYIIKGLDKLFKLKYLRIRDRRISKLPPGIVMLRDLETLDLWGTAVEVLPVGFNQLTKLQHLITGKKVKIPNGIGAMMNLQVISSFDITRSLTDVVEDLGKLTNLKRLDVRLDSGGSGEHKRHEELFLSTLCKIGNNKLKYLKITRVDGSLEFLDSWSPLPSSLQTFRQSGNSCFTSFPKWITPALANLSLLCLNLIGLTVEGLHTLGELPALLSLHLSFKTGPENKLIVQDSGFPSLNVFSTSYGKGANFMFVKGAMPKLEVLSVSIDVSVAKTYGLYSGIEHLPCLKHARVYLPGECATPSNSMPALDAIRKEVAAAFMSEAAAHPNHPTVTLFDEMESKKNFALMMMKSKERGIATPAAG